LSKLTKESILVSSENQFEVLFVGDNSYWQGTTLQFSGSNATQFYSLVLKKLVNWKIFSSAALRRFDLYYFRTNKRTDKISGKDFLENCHRKFKQTTKNSSLEKNRKGWILKIGSRRSNNYLRIYETQNSLKFEHEMKGNFIQKYHFFLVSNLLDELEEKLSYHFLVYFGKLLPLNYSYLDWLVIKLRPIRKQTALTHGLNSDYVKSKIVMDPRNFVSLIQFLNYAQDLDFEIEYLGSTAYRKVVFPIRDFLQFQDFSLKPTNRYRLTKIKEFFQHLQTGLYLTSFSDTRFQSLILVPKIQFEKCPTQKFLIAKVWLVEELFYYNYPFYLPNIFQQKLTKYELEVRVKLFQVFTSVSIKKEISLKDFFNSYPFVLSNQQKTNIKKSLIELLKLLEEYHFIESKYKIISNGSFHHIQELTTRNISEAFVIYEKLSI
jgi:hypothetical protein